MLPNDEPPPEQTDDRGGAHAVFAAEMLIAVDQSRQQRVLVQRHFGVRTVSGADGLARIERDNAPVGDGHGVVLEHRAHGVLGPGVHRNQPARDNNLVNCLHGFGGVYRLIKAALYTEALRKTSRRKKWRAEK